MMPGVKSSVNSTSQQDDPAADDRAAQPVGHQPIVTTMLSERADDA